MSLLKRALKNIRRSPYQSVAVVIIMAVTFLIITVFVIAAVISQRSIAYLESQPKLLIFFQQDITGEDQIKDIKDKLLTTGLVSQIDFISKEDALATYRQLNKDDPLLLELVTPDILPASIEVSLTNPKAMSQLVALVKDDKRVFDITSPEDVVRNLVALTTKIKIFGGLLILILVLDSVLVVLMSTAMRIAIRREEIQIMSLIGASNWYIRKPYLIEGAIYGLAGALIAVVVVYGLLIAFNPTLVNYFVATHIYPLPLWLLVVIAVVEVLAGAGLGILGAFLAVIRYLR